MVRSMSRTGRPTILPFGTDLCFTLQVFVKTGHFSLLGAIPRCRVVTRSHTSLRLRRQSTAHHIGFLPLIECDLEDGVVAIFSRARSPNGHPRDCLRLLFILLRRRFFHRFLSSRGLRERYGRSSSDWRCFSLPVVRPLRSGETWA